jgi:hypothetical protein
MFLFLVDMKALAFHMQQGGCGAGNCCRFHGWGQKEAVVIAQKTSLLLLAAHTGLPSSDSLVNVKHVF